jgi:small subunit ribosomal protein S21
VPSFLQRRKDGPGESPRNVLPPSGSRVIIAIVSGDLKRGECLIRVKVRMNESLDQLLKRFKKACEKEGLTRDIKRTAFYEKPSEKRRRQERQLIRKMQKEANLR